MACIVYLKFSENRFYLNFLNLFYYFMFIGESVRCPGTGVTDSCELPCGCWELNSGPLEEQPVLLTAEPSPQPKENVYN